MLQTLSADARKCIENCTNCHRLCMETIQHCLQLGNEHARVEHIQALMDCAELCQINADFMLRSLHLHQNLSEICKNACLNCAKDCENISKLDNLMNRCAAMCHDCAKSCALMAK